MRHQARRCPDPRCELRFPVPAGTELGRSCPVCGTSTELVDEPWETHGAGRGQMGGRELEGLLDNVRSLRNVGSMFRTADGAGMARLFLAGVTATPGHPGLAKTALGAERAVPWTAHGDGAALSVRLRDDGRTLWALEGGRESTSLFDCAEEAPDRLVLVVGHEVAGIDPKILDHCARLVHLPMLGTKGSLNVSVAFGIAVYTLRHVRPRLPAT